MSTKCSITYRGVTIDVVLGDITKLEVDAVVNPANTLMIMGGGVAGAIKRVGGEEIEKEAMKQAPVPIGRAIATTAGKLPAKYVIHTPTVERPGMRASIENVVKAVRAALEKADELNVKSIAFPGMGTGVGGVPYNQAAEAMISTIRKYIDQGTKIEKIVLVAIDEKLCEEFCRAIDRLLKG
ncbi:MAG: macro domain-containing protein [Thermoprotei archaeon]|nr:MAG: macro domain-containing protein [Thermoprotei archaeon]